MAGTPTSPTDASEGDLCEQSRECSQSDASVLALDLFGFARVACDLPTLCRHLYVDLRHVGKF